MAADPNWPLLESWRHTEDGKIEGLVYGKEGMDDGTLTCTSSIVHMQADNSWCATASGRCYRLGEPAREETPVKASPAAVKQPTLENWAWCQATNGVEGLIYGKAGFEDGTFMRTSSIPMDNRFMTHVITNSGSVYILGAKRPATEPSPAPIEVAAPAPAPVPQPSKDWKATAAGFQDRLGLGSLPDENAPTQKSALGPAPMKSFTPGLTFSMPQSTGMATSNGTFFLKKR